MGRQMQIALDATDFIALLNELSDWNFRVWKHRTETPDPLHAPVFEFEGQYRQILLTFPDSRITLDSENKIDKSDHIEIELSHFDSKEKEPWVNGQRNWNSELIPCLNHGRVYLDTYRMHYTEELRTMQYYEEDEYHLALLKAKYEAISRIIKKEAAVIVKSKDSRTTLYIWPHAYKQVLQKKAGISICSGRARLLNEMDVRCPNGAQPSD